MFKTILIANRGEIAVRVIKTCRRMGIRTVAVYSEADAGSMAVEMADEAVLIGPPPAAESYLRIDKIIEACKRTGAEAVHPGFGFLSENPAFPKALAKEGIVFIGPNPGAIEAMGDKITSKVFAAKANVSTVPGHMDLIKDADEAARIAAQIGYPVMIKASAGGGGKGMRIAYSDQEAKEGYVSAQNEARASFGDDRIFIEKFIEDPRHIEIQVLGDKHGNIIHLGERECSVQRRNQKVLEEAPSPLLDKKTREAMGAQAVALARAVDYDSAGTVEFIADQNKNFYFLEMNTRLQVEHPVTEMVTGLDLVEQMIRVAAGEKLSIGQADVKMNGWAVEARLYAEDPYRKFLPSTGRLKRCVFPAEGPVGDGSAVRVDTGVRPGDEVSMFYDPMIAKVIAHGQDRAQAVETLTRALERCHVEGLQPNTPFLTAVLSQERFRSGRLSTAYIAEEFPEGFAGVEPSAEQTKLFAAVAVFVYGVQAARGNAIAGRMTPPAPPSENWVVVLGREPVAVSIRPQEQGAEIAFAATGEKRMLRTSWRPGAALVEGAWGDEPFAVGLKWRDLGMSLTHRGARVEAMVTTERGAALFSRIPEKEPPDMSKLVVSPMPGLVVSVAVKPGDPVEEGMAVCVVEAMKMENVIRAEGDGEVKAVHIKPGASVAADEVLIELI